MIYQKKKYKNDKNCSAPRNGVMYVLCSQPNTIDHVIRDMQRGVLSAEAYRQKVELFFRTGFGESKNVYAIL
jgi:hypothetical protein